MGRAPALHRKPEGNLPEETGSAETIMDAKTLQSAVLRIVLTALAKRGEQFVPVSSSGRHVHRSQADVDRLFGAGYQLTKLRDLQQPGQFAANERVTLEAGKSSLTLRVVGPARRETQVELSVTDCVKLGSSPSCACRATRWHARLRTRKRRPAHRNRPWRDRRGAPPAHVARRGARVQSERRRRGRT